ncbi:phosphonate ABC transporter ATP-binding protein [Roseicitreum antarcticum]|uniref:Phosphonate transport system ATP-binding protein n=1 Tax=Roseicitreum antarcticum TaxID=564137 RepID=A0A1H2UHR2_9RHOB|nr:phosphonate ABC transporter ATP-binding protein [Roseicitreum antarcticum]SDW55671.1 phosphonate transport system ATP-binding protein [Roseicitreum antarcticum]
MLELRQLSKEFKGNVAVKPADLTIPDGQMVGIIGRSGAGKSTLLRMINRLNDPSGGQIQFHGRDITAMKGRELRKWRNECAMVFQQFNLVGRLNVITNVMTGRLYHHGFVSSMLQQFSARERAFAVRALDRLGMAHVALQQTDTLSGGQMQRVAIARALVQEPKIMLADEPIASLDPLNAKVVMDALRAINQEDGITVVCNLHTLDTARTYCDRIIGMQDGNIVFDGPPKALTDKAARTIYGAEAAEAFSEALTSTSLQQPSGKRPEVETRVVN